MKGTAGDREADPNGSAPASGQRGIWEIKTPGANGAAIGTEAFRGTRASANTSGSDFTLGFGPGEIAELDEIRTERRKPVSSAGPVLEERALPQFDPAV
jgi:hypothetical protein